VAIFGSSPSVVDSSVASVCSALRVPYLTGHPVNINSLDSNRKFAVHLGPSQNDLIDVVTATIGQLKWTDLALISHRQTGEYIIGCSSATFSSTWRIISKRILY
jgi:hypothetical protein